MEVEERRSTSVSNAHKTTTTSANTHLLAVKVRCGVVDALELGVGALGLYPAVKLAVHGLNRGRVAAGELGVGEREEATANRGADKPAEDCKVSKCVAQGGQKLEETVYLSRLPRLMSPAL